MTAELIPRDGFVDLVVDGRLVCSFDDKERAAKVLERYRDGYVVKRNFNRVKR